MGSLWGQHDDDAGLALVFLTRRLGAIHKRRVRKTKAELASPSISPLVARRQKLATRRTLTQPPLARVVDAEDARAKARPLECHRSVIDPS